MMLIKLSYELIKSWRCPIRQQQYLLFFSSHSQATNLPPDPWEGLKPLDHGISYQKWKVDGQTSRNLPEISATQLGPTLSGPMWDAVWAHLNQKEEIQNLWGTFSTSSTFLGFLTLMYFFLLKLRTTYWFWNITSRASTSQGNWIY